MKDNTKVALAALAFSGALVALFVLNPMANPEQVAEAFYRYGCVKTNNFIVKSTRSYTDASERLYRCADGIDYPYSDIKWWATLDLRKKK